MGILCARAFLIFVFVAFGSQAQNASTAGKVPAGLASKPSQLTAKDAAALEESLIANPDNLDTREKLIDYYFMEMATSHAEGLEEKREPHVLWLIEHHPEAEIAGAPEAEIMPFGFAGSTESYQRGKQLWLQQAEKHPDNQRILRNAAQYLLLADGKTSRELLEKAWAIDPNDARTSSALAQSYELERTRLTSQEEKLALAKKIASLRERGLERTDGEERFYELGDVAKSAFEAGEPEKAQQYASELLLSAEKFKNDWNYGNAIHQGNCVLGRVALQRGDVASAKQDLLAAGMTPGSPQLDSFGPNMTLAKELLEKGERDTVVTYLQSCAKFWKMGGEKLQSWIAAIKGGGTPDFGSNLHY